ncbi:hypothetical protein PPACK8108_LOCUS23441 [Phakopsora pachyrhizi]|uniref:OTU domain-containing protein n=1 Tax=Phakopsora pachyrhizi TaxID=170000 RepID=A0AAV0BQL1_PHAPC|nr:hypothetical protein PPACK8108_LOCUS23441 [Phakopsora pachyrhizi]
MEILKGQKASRDAPSKISPVDISSNSNDANCVVFDVDPEPKSYLSGLQQRTQVPETAQSECSFQTPRSSIKPRTEHEELMRYIPQPLQRLIEKIDNPPKDGDCGYTCVAWSSGKGRGISTPELIRKHLSSELKKDKKMYEMIEGRNIDEDIRNTQAGKSAGVAGWLKMPLFGYAIANHLRRPLYYFSLDSMHTYPTNCSYSNYPPFCMAFVDTNHYVVLHFKKVNGSIPAPPIDGWWLRKSSSRNKHLWLQSLENDLKLFQKLMPSASGGAVINVD